MNPVLVGILGTVVGGVLLAAGGYTVRGVDKWREGKAAVDHADHDLLHQIAAVIQDQPPTWANSKGTDGLLTRMGKLEIAVQSMAGTVEAIWQKVDT